MKIGIFDSGLGGLIILQSLVKKLPQYDYLYLGDTKRVPYGNRTQAEIYKFTQQAVDYLFRNNCQLIILACNTVSAQALRKIQQNYLPKHYPHRRVLGVIIPTAEAAYRFGRIGILGTPSTIKSRTFEKELQKLNPRARVYTQAAPNLVYLIENNKMGEIDKILPHYLNPLLRKKISTIILGCTHYPIIVRQIRKITGPNIKLISQTKIIPAKLANYLRRHPETQKKLTKNKNVTLQVSKLTPAVQILAKRWFGPTIQLRQVVY